MEKEKRKRGIGEEAKNGFMSCLTSLLILISIPVGMLLLCVVLFMMNIENHEAEVVAEIQSTIQESCKLSGYEANARYYDSYDLNFYYHESENLTITCYPTNDTWQCTCDEAD